MKKTNVILKNANLDLLKNIDNTIEQVEGEYKGNNAPCVVFEDDLGDVYFVAYSTAEYLQNVNRQPLTLKERKEILKEKIVRKMGNLLSYLKEKYEQSKEAGTIEDIKVELDYWKEHKDDYFSLSVAEKSSYLPEYYPANSAYMKIKNRTFEEQIATAQYKRNLTYLASAEVEALKSLIINIATEEEYSVLKEKIDFIVSLETVKEFMEFIGSSNSHS